MIELNPFNPSIKLKPFMRSIKLGKTKKAINKYLLIKLDIYVNFCNSIRKIKIEEPKNMINLNNEREIVSYLRKKKNKKLKNSWIKGYTYLISSKFRNSK